MPFLIAIVTLVILLNLRLRYVSKNFDVQYDRTQYLKDEANANSARAKDIDESMIIRLSERDLPFRSGYDRNIAQENEIIRIQNKVRLNLEMPVIKTEIPSNIEVKKRFGAANLQKVIDGEENFTRLILHLNQWAKLLLRGENKRDAEAVLEVAVRSRSDVSETYIMLYDLYADTSRLEKIEELKKNIDNLPDIAKIRVCKHIKKESENI